MYNTLFVPPPADAARDDIVYWLLHACLYIEWEWHRIHYLRDSDYSLCVKIAHLVSIAVPAIITYQAGGRLGFDHTDSYGNGLAATLATLFVNDVSQLVRLQPDTFRVYLVNVSLGWSHMLCRWYIHHARFLCLQSDVRSLLVEHCMAPAAPLDELNEKALELVLMLMTKPRDGDTSPRQWAGGEYEVRILCSSGLGKKCFDRGRNVPF